MNKSLVFLYGIVCYVVFLFSFLYAIGFVGNMVVPKTIDSGQESSVLLALIINLVLLGLFAIQHTIMARPAFKRCWTKIIKPEIERSTFVLIASLLLILLYWLWRPMPAVIWSIENPVGKAILIGLFWIGWIIVLSSTFMINHFDLFGLRQVYLHLHNKRYTHVKFTKAGLYKYIRHPLMLGFIVAFWATPYMTAGHLLFALATTAYIIIGIQFEEHDLRNFLGQDYEDYRRHVPMLIPLYMKKPAETNNKQGTNE
jgi:protein-S-isoprenylcysteine O-methyltransferase Ste14